jgi:hypothetical protein
MQGRIKIFIHKEVKSELKRILRHRPEDSEKYLEKIDSVVGNELVGIYINIHLNPRART